MKRLLFLSAFLSLVLCASNCEKMGPGDYRDYQGNRINLLGGWTLTEVQYKTAGVIESKPCEPKSVMEFAQKGIGFTRTLSGELIDSWHYETYRGSVTIFTNAEWENNRGLGEDDDRYERGKTYSFHVLGPDTISEEEQITSTTSLVNIYTRYK